MAQDKLEEVATRCTAGQQSIPQQSKWFRARKIEEKSQHAKSNGEPEEISERKLVAMKFGLDPSSVATADKVQVRAKDDVEEERKRSLSASLGIRPSYNVRSQKSNILSAFGLRGTK